MKESLVEYTISEENLYTKKEKTSISCIKTKRSTGWQNFIQQPLEIQLKLIKPAKITNLEVKGFHTEQLLITFCTDKVIHEEIMKFDYDRTDTIARSIKCQEYILSINLKLSGIEPKKFGLGFFMIRGQYQNALKNNIGNLSKNDQISKSPHQIMGKYKAQDKIFDRRKKQGENKKNRDLDQYLPQEKIQDDIKEAIKKSKETFAQQKYNKEKMEIQQPNNYVDIPIFCKSTPVTEQQLKVFAYVNSGWLLAQRKMEIDRGVKDKVKLSRYIQVQHLHGISFCVDGIHADQREKLISHAKKLGAKFIEDPIDYCWVFTKKSESQKIAKAKKKKGVKIIKPEYVQDCKKLDARLNQKDYLVK